MKPNVTIQYGMFLLAMVLTRRVKVANRLYRKSDADLYVTGLTYYRHLFGNGFFSELQALLPATSNLLSEFSWLIAQAATGNHEMVKRKDVMRYDLINNLTLLSGKVEGIANAPANIEPGPKAIIESAGMCPRPFTPRGKQTWEVMRGNYSGTLYLTAAHVRPGAHEWQYSTNPADETSWKFAKPGLVAHCTLKGFKPGTFVYCRHRTITNAGYSDWEGHDPVMVA